MEKNEIVILILILYVTCAAGSMLKGLIGKDGKVTDSGKYREIVEHRERKVLSYLARYHFTQFNISTCECAIPCARNREQ